MAQVWEGPFQMGDALNEGGPDERPVRAVVLSGFWIDRFEVTKGLWDEVARRAFVLGYDIQPSHGSGKGCAHPVTGVSWYEAVKWANLRSEMEGLTPCYDVGHTVAGAVYRKGLIDPGCRWTANGYRLPTEAEWEKAARGGLEGACYPWGSNIDPKKANYGDNVRSTTPVGSYAPNGYGLYDMAGNVWEWCWDWYGSELPGGGDPHGPALGTYRVIRGGGYPNHASHCRVAHRLSIGSPGSGGSHLHGFRLVRTAP